MTDEPTYGRLLAIKAAAAGPYRLVGRCADCGEEEGVVAFPRPFSTSIAICRRCREVRTGVPDRRGMIQATATISRPDEPVDGTTSYAPSGRIATPMPKTRPSPDIFRRAIVPEAERSPSIDAVRAEIAALDELDRELDRLIDAADQAAEAEDPPAAEFDEVEGIFAPWDDDVDDVKRD